MRFTLKVVVLVIGCAAVTIECLTGSGPVTATSILTVAGTIAVP